MNRDNLRNFFQSPFCYEQFVRFCLDNLGMNLGRYASFRRTLGQECEFECSEEGSHAYHVATYDVSDFERLGVVVYKLSTKTTLNRPIGLRNLAVGLTRYDFDAVLAVFVGENDWRLSYIDGVKDPKRVTPRRYSYVFGVHDELYRTPLDAFEVLMARLKKEEKPALALYKEAFSVEALGERFFKRYKEIYEDFVQEITGLRYVWVKGKKWEEVSKNEPSPLFDASFDGNAKLVRDYVKKMMGRLVFLQFLQKKGWMGVPIDKSYTDKAGERRYLQKLFERSEHQDDFLDQVLEPLFFKTLNVDRRPEDRVNPALWLDADQPIRIPYLSGSLFEADELDTRRCRFSAEHFRNLFDLFDQFNFTIDEADPSDAEVGVAPEMLGKIFENLLEDNKDKGAFYTPREIVQYMCQEALIAYLLQNTRMDARMVEALVREHKFPENESREVRQALRYALEQIKVCDPAIGSGAFPMGMLHELLACRKALACEKSATADQRREAFTRIKRHIIENNIYGVDVEQGAVDIARLRFWLALVVDEKEPHPLVNLDYKIVRGDSLCAMYDGMPINLRATPGTQNRVDAKLKEFHHHADAYMAAETAETRVAERKATNLALLDTLEAYYIQQSDLSTEAGVQQGTFAFADELIQPELKRVTPVATDDASRRMLARIKTLRTRISNGENLLVPFFDWNISYSDVMAKGGFDIVIGNPPYIHFENAKKLGELYKKSTPLTYTARGDIYCSFYEKGASLLKEGGYLCYITSNKWMRAAYGEKLRAFLSTRMKLAVLVDFAGAQIFDAATVDTNILLAQKLSTKDLPISSAQGQTKACLAQDDKATILSNLAVYISTHSQSQGFSATSSSWSILSSVEQSIKSKIEQYGVPLKDWDLTINYGIKTGLNEAFIIDGATRNRLILEDPKSAEIIRPILRGRDIKRYSYTFADKWLISTFPALKLRIDDYPAVRDYLLAFDKKVLAQTGEKNIDGIRGKNARKKTRNKWFETQDQIAYWSLFSQPKIIWMELTTPASFAFDAKGYYLNNTCYIMTSEHVDLRYILDFLNSPLCVWYFDKICATSGVGTRRWIKQYVEQIRVPRVSGWEAQGEAQIFIALSDAFHLTDDERTSLLNSLGDEYSDLKKSLSLSVR